MKCLYNVLYTVSTQQYIITVIKYIQSGHIAFFNRQCLAKKNRSELCKHRGTGYIEVQVT